VFDGAAVSSLAKSRSRFMSNPALLRKLCAAVVFAAAWPAAAAEFQNLSFENYPGGPTLPNWQLVVKNGTGTQLLFQGEGPGTVAGFYPFVGLHIGEGPVIAVGPLQNANPQALDGANALTLISYASGAYNSVSAAQAYIATQYLGGIAQTATVPAGAKSFWIATPTNASPPVVTFSGHNLQMEPATFQESFAMFEAAGQQMPLALGGPGPFPPGNMSWQLWGGNIETVAGIDRELMLQSRISAIPVGPNQDMFDVFGPPLTADMMMFSSVPWDGAAVGVPEPIAALVLLPAVAALRRRRHHA
jgi:hypothetical protein